MSVLAVAQPVKSPSQEQGSKEKPAFAIPAPVVRKALTSTSSAAATYSFDTARRKYILAREGSSSTAVSRSKRKLEGQEATAQEKAAKQGKSALKTAPAPASLEAQIGTHIQAFRKHQLLSVMIALSSGQDVCLEQKNQALLTACEFGWINPARLVRLIKAGADVNCCNPDGFSPLTLVIMHQKNPLPWVKELISAGANINGQKPSDPETEETDSLPVHRPLIEAARKGYFSMVKLLIKEGADLNLSDVEAVNPLSVAAEYNHVAVIEALLEAGADVEGRESDSGDEAADRAPILNAAKYGHKKSLELLLKAGAKPMPSDTFNTSAYAEAAENGHTETLRFLISQASEEERPALRDSALVIACLYGKVQTATALLDDGANPNGDLRLSGEDDVEMVDSPFTAALKSPVSGSLIELLSKRGAKIPGLASRDSKHSK